MEDLFEKSMASVNKSWTKNKFEKLVKKIVSSQIDFLICTWFIAVCATGELKSPVLYGLAAAFFGGALEHRADRTRPPRSESETKN